jgi:hypothetical protein
LGRGERRSRSKDENKNSINGPKID